MLQDHDSIKESLLQTILDMRDGEFLKLSHDGNTSVFASQPASLEICMEKRHVLIVGHHISLWFW